MHEWIQETSIFPWNSIGLIWNSEDFRINLIPGQPNLELDKVIMKVGLLRKGKIETGGSGISRETRLTNPDIQV